MRRLLVIGCSVVLVAACDKEGEEESSAIAAIASINPAIAQKAPEPAAAEPKAPEKPVVRRPADESDLDLTEARRARLEDLHPEAAGFATSSALEKKLYALNLLRGKSEAAMKALDRIAKGQWVLFTGHIVNPTPESFEMAVRYTPRDKQDPLGLTSQWINVTLTSVEGYDAKEYEPGDYVAALAKYQGEGKASSGYDVILLDQWYEREK